MNLLLDTNVVLDWLLFNDVRLTPLRMALQTGQACVLRQVVMEIELQRVLAYPLLQLGADRQQDIMTRYRQQTRAATLPALFSADNLCLPEDFPCCRDRDDQPFIALAYHTRAALVSHDKAVLKLRNRARRFGVVILDLPELNDLMASSAG